MDSAWLLLNRRGGALVENTHLMSYGMFDWLRESLYHCDSGDQRASNDAQRPVLANGSEKGPATGEKSDETEDEIEPAIEACVHFIETNAVLNIHFSFVEASFIQAWKGLIHCLLPVLSAAAVEVDSVEAVPVFDVQCVPWQLLIFGLSGSGSLIIAMSNGAAAFSNDAAVAQPQYSDTSHRITPRPVNQDR